MDIVKLAKAFAALLPFLYIIIAFGGAIINNEMSWPYHLSFAIAEFICGVVIVYDETE